MNAIISKTVREYPMHRKVTIARVLGRHSDEYDGVSMTVGMDMGTNSTQTTLYLEDKDQLEQLICDLIAARIDWGREDAT